MYFLKFAKKRPSGLFVSVTTVLEVWHLQDDVSSEQRAEEQRKKRQLIENDMNQNEKLQSIVYSQQGVFLSFEALWHT